MKQIDETSGRLGAALRHARRVCQLSSDDAAALLNITPNELYAYERGTTKIPIDILEHALILGYKMMQVRVLEKRYRRQRDAFRTIQRTVSDA